MPLSILLSLIVIAVGALTVFYLWQNQWNATPLTTARRRFSPFLSGRAPLVQDSVIRSMDSAVLVVDGHQRITYANPAAQTLFGLPQSQFSGQPLTQLLPSLDQAFLEGSESHATRDEVVLTITDAERAFEFSLSPLIDNDRCSMGHVLLLHDVTQTRELLKSLRDARDAALEATRIRNEFIANITHEIRTPMNAVIAMTDLLLETDLSDEQQEYLHAIRTCGDILVDLSNSVLDFSKIESGVLELENNPFSIRNCIEQTIVPFAVQAAHNGIRLTYEMDELIPQIICGDVVRLRQVLINLVDNALKFTRQGEIKIVVSGEEAGDQFTYHFEIHDSGIGIPEEKIHRLFQSFSQVDASTAREYGGTGLGLAICRGLIEKMGGSIWVESKVNVGTTFHFTIQAETAGESAALISLPLHTRSGARYTSAGPEPSADYTDTTRLQDEESLRILVGDDNQFGRRVAQRLLASLGYHADIAATGAQILTALSQFKYDVVLLDLQMPNLDGFDIARAIRSRETAIAQPYLIALTGSIRAADRECALAAGMNDYISKPIQIDALAKAICRARRITSDREHARR